ncbi:chromatin-remodeling complex ATPase chain isw-1 [Arthroderma uncinatum]|uniref:chromatin-remodeling complex ATPase chain isw-1 n=1 Tax=Arthroderma uncinatum TaxID=74035 RepID=UPI00144A7C60|nr:chromatin-remodeling complex ATPase chain isw-1 [Arthroderma uncinatum]KAF3482405.1 chromatin-remodeling complex ATPase chain isw-1 [Arthroderma uncinatum]
METDPFLWSIDEVVAYLCHGSFEDWARSSLPRPNPIPLENNLRENYVTGEVLLTEVDREALSRYLGLKPLGHQATIFKAIQYLRSRSSEFSKSANAPVSAQQPVAAAFDSLPGPSLPPPPPPHIQNTPIQTPTRPPSTPRVPLTNGDSSRSAKPTPKQPVLPPPGQKENDAIASDGRKRRRLNPDSLSTRAFRVVPENPRRKRYLCSQKQPVKDIFYNGIESDDDNDTFGFIRPPNSSRGQSLYVNKRMQHFLQQVPQPFKDGKEGSLALFPYDKTVASDAPLYFTLFEKNDGEYSARMEAVEKWPHLKEKSALDYLLVKYPPQGDELPLYGESGSEDYDSDTCRDMDEARDDAEDESNSNTSGLMSVAELSAIIDNFIADTIDKWKESKLPSQEGKARTLWRQSRKRGTVSSDIRRANTEITRLNERLANWSKGIKSNEYEKGDEDKVLRQCASLEITINQRELQRWRLSVLELETCPPKLSRPVSRSEKVRPRLQRDDEESIGSDTDDALDDDSDFVVSDDAQEGHNAIRHPRETRTITPSTSSIPSGEDTSSPPACPITPSPMNGPFEDIEFVDLTQGDQADQREMVEDSIEPPENLEINTPPLNPVEGPKASLPFPSSTLIASPASGGTPPADTSTAVRLPDVTDVAGICNIRMELLQELRDRKRFLAKIVYLLADAEQVKLASLVGFVEKNTLRLRIREALRLLSKNKKGRISNVSDDDVQYYKRVAALYVSWHQIIMIPAEGIPRISVNESRATDKIIPFHSDLTEILRVKHPREINRELSCEIITPSQKSHSQGSPQAGDPIVIEDDIDNLCEKDGEMGGGVRATPRKRRKRAVAESREAMESQNRAQRRVEEQATQQRRLLEERGIENHDPQRKIVSFDDPVIYLHRDIGRHVKEHQVSGIQFMWRELIKDEKHEGCLLAHTMGLGKTMQVVSLLVTIANASNSPDPKIRSQVPERFRLSKTLVTCPSSLIDNWWEEFGKWTPRDEVTQHNLGVVRKAVGSVPKRLSEINAWYTEGGVLLISHELFRRMILNPSRKNGSRALSDGDFQLVKRQLLEGPNIIVADEAHKLKNGASDISKTCSMFKSKSRIALTGSPLSNQLIDYYQMINWISPDYLGNLKQFKAKYEEPIREGLYFDSTNWEYRRSRKRLEVLKKVLEPKVNRADISVIQSDLPPKVEFVIVIPVTRLQEETYNQFISMTMEGRELEDEVIETEAQSTITDELVSQFELKFQDIPNLDSPEHSRRTQMVGQIVDESINAGDKVLIFSGHLYTLTYIGLMLEAKGQKFCRLDGQTLVATRQAATKAFSRSDSDSQVYLISTKAGALGLNIIGANRVIIFESDYNPTWEEQAIGRAYRLGQTKEVFVYRFVMGGTFEELIHEKGVFKKNMALRAVDKKNPTRSTGKDTSEFRRPVRSIEKHDLSEFYGKDPKVLDKILARPNDIHKITLTETLHREDAVQFTPEEKNEIQAELDDEQLERSDPVKWAQIQEQRRLTQEEERRRALALALSRQQQRSPSPPGFATGRSLMSGYPPSMRQRVPPGYNGPPPLTPDFSVFNPRLTTSTASDDGSSLTSNTTSSLTSTTTSDDGSSLTSNTISDDDSSLTSNTTSNNTSSLTPGPTSNITSSSSPGSTSNITFSFSSGLRVDAIPNFAPCLRSTYPLFNPPSDSASVTSPS